MAKKYSIDLKKIEIEIGDKQYYLREFSGVVRDQFLNSMAERIPNIATGDAAKAAGSVRNFNGMQASLVALCLFDEKNQPVPLAVINEWPATVVSALFKDAQSLNGMGGDAEKEAKKASSASEPIGTTSPTV